MSEKKVQALVLIMARERTADILIKELAGWPEVVQLTKLEGHWEILATFEGESIPALRRLVTLRSERTANWMSMQFWPVVSTQIIEHTTS